MKLSVCKRDHVLPCTQCTVKFLANPVFFIHTTVQRIRRQNNNKIFAVFKNVQKGTVEISALQAVSIEKNTVTFSYENIPQVLCGICTVFSAITDENIIFWFFLFHFPPAFQLF